MTAIRNMPKNINKSESASLTPFLDTKNKPTVSGNKSIIINPSNRNWEEKAVNPAKNLWKLNSGAAWNSTPTIKKIVIPMTAIIPYEIKRRIFFCLGILDLKIKNNDIGNNVAITAFDNMANT